jgi:tryptophanyl-tRNA synthetase
MNFAEYKKTILSNFYNDIEAKAKQFGIINLDNDCLNSYWDLNKKHKESLINSDVFGVINIESLDTDKEFSVILGLKPSKIHLGHLNIINEVKYWEKIGGKVFFVLGYFEKLIDLNFDKDSTYKISENIQRQLSEGIKNKVSIIDTIYPEWNDWQNIVENQITVNKVNQLLGWDKNKTLRNYKIVSNMVTSFLAPQFFLQHPTTTVIPCGVTELPFIELSKIVANKLNLIEPTATFKYKIPSVNNSERMSSNSIDSTIFMDDSIDVIKTKLLKTKTGGRATVLEQKQIGGDPLKCPFLKLVTFFIDATISNVIINDCLSGNLCSDCKKQTLQVIKKDLKDLIIEPYNK